MGSETQGSPKYKLNWLDGQKILKGLLIAFSGAGLTYIANQLPNIDLGQYNYILFPLLSSLVNAGLKWYADNK